MRGKLLLVVGLVVGYVLGARAGRERYEDIKRVVGKLWSDPRVQRQVKNAEGRAKDFAMDKAPEVVDFLSDGAKKLVGKSGRTPAARKAAAKSAAAKSAAAKSAAAKSAAASDK